MKYEYNFQLHVTTLLEHKMTALLKYLNIRAKKAFWNILNRHILFPFTYGFLHSTWEFIAIATWISALLEIMIFIMIC